MANIIANKLGVQMGMTPVTPLSCLRLVYHILRNAAHAMDCGQFYDDTLKLHELEMQLEILTCDAECANMRATELALVLVCAQMDAGLAKVVVAGNTNFQNLIDYAVDLQKMCRVSEPFHSAGICVRHTKRSVVY